MLKKCGLMFYSEEEGHTLGANYHFWGINEHFGGPSVHCGQILQKNPGKGQSPPFLAMLGFWVHMDSQPLPTKVTLLSLTDLGLAECHNLKKIL